MPRTVPPGLRADLQAVLRRGRFVSQHELSWDGKPVLLRPSGDARRARTAPGFPAIVEEAAWRIYADCYACPENLWLFHCPDLLLRKTFVGLLDGALADIPSLCRLPAPEPLAAAAGAWRERTGGGWYHVDGGLAAGDVEGRLLRIYWNVCAAGALPLLVALTTRLATTRVPFHLKILDDPQAFVRADAAVLYLPAARWAEAAAAIGSARLAAACYLRKRAPLFTRRLAPGVGAAEDPGGGESFGLLRSRLVAQGMWRAHAGQRGASGALAAVAARFAEAGLSLRAPHLAPGSRARYALPGGA